MKYPRDRNPFHHRVSEADRRREQRNVVLVVSALWITTISLWLCIFTVLT